MQSNELCTEALWKVIQKCILTISEVLDSAWRVISVQVNGGKHCEIPEPIGLPQYSLLAWKMTLISDDPWRSRGAHWRCVCCIYKTVHYRVSNTKSGGSHAIVSWKAFVMKTQNTNLSNKDDLIAFWIVNHTQPTMPAYKLQPE